MGLEPDPSHEALISRELFEQVEVRAERNSRRATLAAPKPYAQQTGGRHGRLYPLRGRVRCGICGRRMEGSHQKDSNWVSPRVVRHAVLVRDLPSGARSCAVRVPETTRIDALEIEAGAKRGAKSAFRRLLCKRKARVCGPF